MVRVKGSTYGSYETPCMSFKEIRQRLKIPTKTAASYYYRGMNKLKQQPGALEGLIECVHAVAMSEKRNSTSWFFGMSKRCLCFVF